MQNLRDKKKNPFEEKTVLLAFAFISIFFLYMIRMFLLPVFMAGILTGVTWPLYKGIKKVVRIPWISSLVCLCLLTLLVVGPVMTMAIAAYREAIHFFDTVHLQKMLGVLEFKINQWLAQPPSWMESVSGIHNISQYEINLKDHLSKFANSYKNIAIYIFSGGTALSKSLVTSTTAIIFTLFTMFYFYLDGKRILASALKLFPMDDRDEKKILQEMASTTRATLQGALLIGVIQGILGGMVLWLAGVPSPIFWTVVMIILSLIPSVGTALVLFPTSIILMFMGSMAWGIFVLVSAVLIGVVDNLLRPRLVGKDLKMHDLMIFFSTIGGIGMFGLPGFILGPVTASLFMSFLRIYSKRYSQVLPVAEVLPTPQVALDISHPNITYPNKGGMPATRPTRRNPGRRKPKKKSDS